MNAHRKGVTLMYKSMVLVFHSSIINNAEDKTGCVQVPEGTYTVQLKKVELRETATRQPIIVISYTIQEGIYRNSTITQQQRLDTGVGIANAYDILRMLDNESEIVFRDYVQFATLIKEVEAKAHLKEEVFQVCYNK